MKNSDEEIAKGRIESIIRNARLTGREDVLINAGRIAVDIIEKGKASPIGTIQTYSGYKYVKTADGWKPFKEGIKTEPMGGKKEEDKDLKDAMEGFDIKLAFDDGNKSVHALQRKGERFIYRVFHDKKKGTYALSRELIGDKTSPFSESSPSGTPIFTKQQMIDRLKQIKSGPINPPMGGYGDKPEDTKYSGLVGKHWATRDSFGDLKSSKIKSVSKNGDQYKVELEDGTSKFVNKEILDKLASGEKHTVPGSPYSDKEGASTESVSEGSKRQFSPAQESFLERMGKQVIDNDDNSPWVEPWGDLNGKEIREKLGAKFKLSESEFEQMNSKGIIKVAKTVTSRGAFAKVTIGKNELKNALKAMAAEKFEEGKSEKKKSAVGDFYKDYPSEDKVKEFTIDGKPYTATHSQILSAIKDKEAYKINSIKKDRYGFSVKYSQRSGSFDSRDSGEVSTFVSFDSIKNKTLHKNGRR